jgi:RNA polymerase sigma-70 factor (ECF subfamily)
MRAIIQAAAPPVAVSPASDDAGASPRTFQFRELFEAHAPFVWRALLALGVGEGDVADASQQVFLVLHRKLGRLDPGCSPRTFMYGICLRVAADYRKRKRRRHEHLVADVPEVACRPIQEERAWQQQSLQRLRVALDGLAPGQREVFVLYEIEELPMVEVARAIGRSLQTAYGRLYAARKAVAAALEVEVGMGEGGRREG